MKKRALVLASVWSLVFVSLAFADPNTTAPTITLPPNAPWYAQIIATIFATIFPALMGALIWLSSRISQFVSTKLADVKTAEQGKWYSAAFLLAGMAVRAAETQFGPDTAKGEEKKRKASQWLIDRLVAQDPNFLKKNPNAQDLVNGLIDAAYHDAFVAVAPLK